MPRKLPKRTSAPPPTAPAGPAPKDLRTRAQEQLLAESAALSGRTVDELKPVIQNLQIHQMELEMQNEELRRAQVELAHTRDEYTDLYEFAPVGYLTLSPAGVIQRANLFAASLLGVERSKLIGARLSRFVARSSQNAFFLHSRELVSLDEKKVVEIDVGKGAKCTVRLHSHLHVNVSGAPPVWRAVLIEVTESRRVELELRKQNDSLEERVTERTAALEESVKAARESQAQLAGIVGAAMDAIISVDDESRILLFNAAAEQVFGWTAAQVMGRPLETLIPHIRRQEHASHLRAFATSGVNQRRIDPPRPLAGLRADGTEFPLEAAISHSSVEGRMIFTIILRDISRRVRAMEAMLENETALMDFFTAAPLGLIWVRPDGTVERANQAQLSLLDRKSDEVIGQPLADFHADPDVITQILNRVAKQETVQNERAKIRRKDGTIRHILIDANGLWKQERLLHSRWFIRDVTRRLDLEREILAIAERERERVGRELHDDLCQELLGIEFKTEHVAKTWESISPGAAQDARKISKAIRRAIEHARELARGLSPTATMVDQGLIVALQELAARTQKVFRRRCSFRCDQAVSIPDSTTAIHLYRIAQEAVSNAIRHGKASRIEIQLTAQDCDLTLGVHDNGGGMPKGPGKSKGMGLRMMQYRAGVINGSLAVQHEATGGTAIVCTVKDALRPPTTSSPP